MWFSLGQYLRPTPQLHELRILTHLSEHPETTQAELARVLGLAPAMANTYLRRLAAEGLLEMMPLSGRDYKYYLTPAGEKQRLYHVITFSAELNALFDWALNDLKKRIADACGRQPCRIVLYGAGETGKMCYLAIRGLDNITLIGVVDDDPVKIGSTFFEYRIEPAESIRRFRPDKVLVASWLHSDTMAQRLTQLIRGHNIGLITLVPREP